MKIETTSFDFRGNGEPALPKVAVIAPRDVSRAQIEAALNTAVVIVVEQASLVTSGVASG